MTILEDLFKEIKEESINEKLIMICDKIMDEEGGWPEDFKRNGHMLLCFEVEERNNEKRFLVLAKDIFIFSIDLYSKSKDKTKISKSFSFSENEDTKKILKEFIMRLKNFKRKDNN